MKFKTLASGEKLYNPLAEEKDDNMTAISLDNSKEGYCPKCSSAMGTSMSGKETVWYCAKCRVSSPLCK